MFLARITAVDWWETTQGTVSNSYATGNVTGTNYSGGLAGYNQSTISNSYATGNVTGSYMSGGLVGYQSSGTVSNSYASGAVSGGVSGSYIGGLVGYQYLSTVSNSYASGAVTGLSSLGGLVGFNSLGTVSNSFWNTTTSGLLTSSGGTGLATAQMMQLASFSSWNAATPNTIANTGGSGAVWRLYEGHTAPLLTSFMTALTLADAPDAALTYNSTTQTAATTATTGLLGAAASGLNAGFYNGYYSTQQGFDITGGNLTINQAVLTVTGLTASNKVYDATTAATLTGTGTLTGVFAGDLVNLGASLSGVFADKNVGTGKTVAVSAASLTGASAGNYTVNSSTSLTANITPAALVVTATGSNRVYNGLLTDAVTLTDNRFTGDLLNLANTSATFADKNVGTAKAVSVSGITVTGVDAANYTFNTTASTTANITPAQLTVTGLAASNKVYDATTTATISGTAVLTGQVVGDTVNLAATVSGLFADKNVANGKTVTVSGASLTGVDAINYTVVAPAGLTANITPATLTVTGLTASNKVYNATTAATLTGTGVLTGKLVGDVVNLAGTVSGVFLDKNVANAKAVTVSGSSIIGADANNYQLSATGLTANISAAALTVSATGSNRVYNGLLTDAVTLTDNRFTGDLLNLANTSATFADKNVGTAKAVSVSGITVTGVDAANYTFNTTAATTANITPATLSVTGLVANNKVYDATTTATISGTAVLTGQVVGDTVNLAATVSGLFADKNVANGKTVTVSGASLTGVDAINYTVVAPAGLTANITPATLTVTGLTASNKVYNATTAATLTGTGVLTGKLVGDVVNLAGTVSGVFLDKNVANAKAVTVSGSSIIGADANNYQLSATGLTANISAAALTVSATGSNRVYNGLLTDAVTLTDNRFTGDLLNLANTSATFADKNVGTAKAVSVSGITVTGVDAANYTFNTTASTTANITPAQLTVTGLAASNKVYDATTTATISGTAVLTGQVVGDTVNLAATVSGLFADKNVANGKTVTVSGASLTGVDAINYTVVAPAGLTANITPATLTVTGLTASNKVYNATTAATLTGTGVLSGVLLTDAVNLAGTVSGVFLDKNVGVAKAVAVSGSSIIGADATNYQLSATGLTANISAAALTVSAAGSNRVYNGLLTDAVTLSDNRFTGDLLNLANTSATFADKNVGTAKAVTVTGITVTGVDAANYTFNTTASTTANITPAVLTVSAVGTDRVYNSLLTDAVILSDNRIAGDLLTLANTSANFTDKNVANGKTVNVSGITVTGVDAGNYTFNSTASTTANITPATLTVTGLSASNKVYDSTTVATLAGTGVLTGKFAGDVVNLAGTVSGVFPIRMLGLVKS